MTTARAIEILRQLADGRDPATGQPFPPDSPYHQADTVRALFLAIESLGSPAVPSPATPPHAASPSNRPDQLAQVFNAAQPFASAEQEEVWLQQVAVDFGCTTRAIRARLVRLGLIPHRSALGTRRPDAGRPQFGRPWTADEEQQLRETFAAGKPLADIAAAHGRTIGAITSRLIRLGLIADPRASQVPTAAAPSPGGPSPAPAALTPEDLRDLPF